MFLNKPAESVPADSAVTEVSAVTAEETSESTETSEVSEESSETSEEASETSEISESSVSETETESETEATSETSETAEETTVPESETEAASESAFTIPAASEGKTNVHLDITHQMSQGQSVSVSYDTAGKFDPYDMSDTSYVIAEYTTPATLSPEIMPVVMRITDGTVTADVPALSKTDSYIVFDYETIKEIMDVSGFTGGLETISNISFAGIGMPVDVTSVTITDCIIDMSHVPSGYTFDVN